MKILLTFSGFDYQKLKKIVYLFQLTSQNCGSLVFVNKKKRQITQTRYVQSKEKFKFLSYNIGLIINVKKIKQKKEFFRKIIKLLNVVESVQMQIKFIK